MTPRDQSNAFDQVVQLLAGEGFEGMAQAIQTLLNEAMKLERPQVLGAAPDERSSSLDTRTIRPAKAGRKERVTAENGWGDLSPSSIL